MAKNTKAEGKRGSEQYEVKKFVESVRPFLKKLDARLSIETQKNLWYTNYRRFIDRQEDKQMSYAVDILVSENNIPRVAVECKIKTYSTHDVITYSEKSGKHKTVYPHLRYGFLLLNSEWKKFTRRYFEHANHFDFKELFFKNIEKEQLKAFAQKIVEQSEASREIEKEFFN